MIEKITEKLKRFTPRSLFGRALLILVLPVILVQLVVTWVFYDKHWASLTRHLSNSLAGEVAWVVERWHREPDADIRQQLRIETLRHMGLTVTMEPSLRIGNSPSQEVHFPVFETSLRKRIDLPFALRYLPEEQLVHILILVEGGMLRIEAPEKRLASPTTLIFMAWTLGAALLFSLIAVIFLRNQIRPIVRLAEVAERFGKGLEAPGFKPSGAREVRQAARAFIDMRSRIRRQVESRTGMLAGISHDLRTPLTRMTLQLAMLPPSDATAALQQDVKEMEHMVDEYLAFARGEDGEQPQQTTLQAWVDDLIEPYRKHGKNLSVGKVPQRGVTLRKQAMQRAVRNLIDNALAYGTQCWVSVEARRRHLRILVEDDGPGIPQEDYDRAFQAFERLDEARNSETGGAGLGLSIVRDIIHSHGGDISLSRSHHGGLLVLIELPL